MMEEKRMWLQQAEHIYGNLRHGHFIMVNKAMSRKFRYDPQSLEYHIHYICMCFWNVTTHIYGKFTMGKLKSCKQFYIDELLEVHVFTLTELGWTDTRWNKIIVMVCNVNWLIDSSVASDALYTRYTYIARTKLQIQIDFGSTMTI